MREAKNESVFDLCVRVCLLLMASALVDEGFFIIKTSLWGLSVDNINTVYIMKSYKAHPTPSHAHTHVSANPPPTTQIQKGGMCKTL